MDASGLVVGGGLGRRPPGQLVPPLDVLLGGGAGETVRRCVCVLCIHMDYVFIHKHIYTRILCGEERL